MYIHYIAVGYIFSLLRKYTAFKEIFFNKKCLYTFIFDFKRRISETKSISGRISILQKNYNETIKKKQLITFLELEEIMKLKK